jgi:translocation and assembly module TamB
MKKVQSKIKKVINVILWVAISFVLLFVIIAVLIQIPAVQNKIVQYATSFVSNKTHTKVDIRKISISFPKSVVIEGLYLEDIKKDTLIYAGKAKVNIALYDLFQSKIAISSFELDDVNLNLHNTVKDSLFNYNFLLNAFGDTAIQVKTDTLTVSKWTFSIKDVKMKNIRLRYDDEYGGMDVNVSLQNLKLQMEKLDLENSVYKIDELLIAGSTANLLIKESSYAQNKESGSVLPKITANKIQINNSTVTYADSITKQSAFADINRFELNDGLVDLQNEIVSIGYFTLSKSKIQYQSFDTILSTDSTVKLTIAPAENNWKVSVNSLVLDDNSVTYKVGDKPEIKNAFNPDYMEYTHLSLETKDLFYSSDQTKVLVKQFSATDQNNFAITDFETDFSMDQHSISAKNLKANTTNSSIDADFNIQYTSLATLMDSMQFSNLDLDLKNLSFTNSDILYFSPELIEQPFFKNRSTITSASGTISGQLNNLNAKNLAIKTGDNTILKTDFSIIGLPEVQTASFSFPNLSLLSGKKDIKMMAGSFIPVKIELPENINLRVVFKGKMKSFESTVDMSSSFGAAHLFATIDPNENFSSKISLDNFDLGRLLKDTILFGPVFLTAEANGLGLNLQTIKAKIKAEVSQIYLKQYTYHNLNIDGTVTGKQFEGKINIDDKNVVFDFDGLVNLNPNQECYKFRLNMLGADLQKLNLAKKDVRISFVAVADLKGDAVNNMNGTAGITNIIIAQEGKIYLLDSFLSVSVNEPKKSEITVNSALIGIKYSGTVSPASLPAILSQFINKYFPLSDSNRQQKKSDPSKFSFEVQLHNHPILSKVLVPQLKEFEPGIIQGSFDSEKNDLKLKTTMKKIVYGTTEIKDLEIDVNSDNAAINYKISSQAISNSQFNLDNFLLDGKLAENKIFANISSTDGKKKTLLIQSQVTKENGSFKLILDPKEFYLVNNKWNIAADNFIEFGKQGFRIHNFYIDHNESKVLIESVHERFNDDLNIAIQNFRLDDLSKIVQKDTSLVKGTVDGSVLLKRVAESYGLISDLKITNLIVHDVPIGDLMLKAERSEAKRFDIDLNLSGPDNNLTADGYFIPNGGDKSINIKAVIQSLSMKTVEAFSMGQFTEASGTLTGNFLIEGTADAPGVSGELVFNNAFLKPAFLNNRLELKHETIQLKKDGIFFDSFTMLDGNQNTAIINGSILMKQFSDFIFDLQVNTKDFLLFNTRARNNKVFFGRMVIDSKINVIGPMNLPVVNAKVKMKEGSNFTFSVPEDKLTTDKGEDVVEFETGYKLNPILNRDNKKEIQKTNLTGFDITSIIEIDKEATLRLLMDPTSTDSLVVKGEAALSFTMDQSGKMSLTGAYNLNEGSYLVSLESVIKKKFDIDAGSTIIWNGDPLDAAISIDARYFVRASPYDLVADQISGLSDMDKGGYKQRYPFLIILKLRGEILHPEISFEIQLRPEDKGILGGAVNQKLNMLNEDESALNKQVFALLVLGRFVQENPFQTESAGGASTLIRSTVGKFLSAQLNQLSSKMIPGMEVNFDIQSFDDYQTGQAKGRTQVGIGIKKQLFNERLSVQLGGTVDVEGDQAKQNSASDITSDVTVEYKLNKDGSLRMKGFRHNQYEGAIEGQLVETGVGVVYVRDFNQWSRLFRSQRTRRDSTIIRNKNGTTNQ